MVNRAPSSAGVTVRGAGRVAGVLPDAVARVVADGPAPCRRASPPRRLPAAAPTHEEECDDEEPSRDRHRTSVVIGQLR